MIISEDHGGLGFSVQAQSEVVSILSTRSIALAVTVMVPNSLGPGELLHRFGTKAQQDYYLPRLASGEEIPAFGLTGPYAGSDAASMRDTGIVWCGLAIVRDDQNVSGQSADIGSFIADLSDQFGKPVRRLVPC